MSSILFLSLAPLLWGAQITGETPAIATPDPPELGEWRKCMAEGNRLYDAGRLREATPLLEKAVHNAEHFAALDSRLPATIHDLAFLYHMQGQYADAARCYLRAIHLWEGMGPSQHSALLRSTDNLIGTYVENHEYRAAKKLMASRLPEMERSATQWRDRAVMLNMRAGLAHVEHHYDEAERWFRQSVALWEQHLPEESRNFAITVANLSQVLVVTKRYREAYELELRALAVFEKLDPAVGPLALRDLTHAAICAVKLGRTVDAEQHYQRALTLAQQVFGPQHPASGQIMLRYSTVLRALERTAEAKSMAREAHAILGAAGKGTVDVLALAPLH
jgi:tetratricopeptide (TPR) repeat protein